MSRLTRQNVAAAVVLVLSLLLAGFISEHRLDDQSTQPIGAKIGTDVVLDHDLRVRVVEVRSAQVVSVGETSSLTTDGLFLVVTVQAAEHGSGAVGGVQCHLVNGIRNVYHTANSTLVIPQTGFQSRIDMVYEIAANDLDGWSIECGVSDILHVYSRVLVTPLTVDQDEARRLRDEGHYRALAVEYKATNEVIPDE